ncbi:MAG: DUF177 domain-containing protein [Yaniella sp.]|uniref:YceD family protein n=1 Tax=Yaniella sp. TaxID=2773929 RepID=UPI0026471C0C|nr:DUF177 domain-containing protein [Yaniella sp.]MDN5703830.1 DUF177 domain-containing protein [Yaniella sp.]MDN5731568.1 DUF177 domain-containing protein [Yaniella sp.]MDN5741938.1 DUF177 domain-containing protein [Yaniella sp.]MDN5816235.1 DUF177 domain-containing protein [Yaniella sp.]MDN5817389.1 DUF177 domain-containing protein [Yaniella sp.]
MSENSIQSGVTLPDEKKPWVVAVTELIDTPGASEELQVTWPAPAELAVPLLGVEKGSAMQVDVRLDSVHEGILVSGTVDGTLTGQCSRCLDPISQAVTIDIQELFQFEFDPMVDEDEQHMVEHGFVNVEPIMRDALVSSLPFQPTCSPDCEGLCDQCGVRLEEAGPDHYHEQLDPRWAALANFVSGDETEETSSDNS